MPLSWFANHSFPLYLAPMAGFTDKAFRTLAKEQGADVMVSEFVHARALLYGDDHPWNTLAFDETQRPFGIQLFGDDSAAMAEAARRVCERMHPDFIDLNFGCPSPRVTGSCAGSALLRDLPRLARISQAVVNACAAVHTPVTAKTRLGWDSQSIVASQVLQIAEDSGLSALTIHGRTRAQGYSGKADWATIGQLAQKSKIPIVANGSIRNAGDILRLKSDYPAIAGAMIGRAAIGYPWIFREIKAALAGNPIAPPTLKERWDTLLRYAEYSIERMEGDQPLRPLHSALAKLTTGMPDSRTLRHDLNAIGTLDELKALAQKHLAAQFS